MGRITKCEHCDLHEQYIKLNLGWCKHVRFLLGIIDRLRNDLPKN